MSTRPSGTLPKSVGLRVLSNTGAGSRYLHYWKLTDRVQLLHRSSCRYQHGSSQQGGAGAAAAQQGSTPKQAGTEMAAEQQSHQVALDRLLASLKEMQREGFTVATSKMGELGIQGRAGSPVFLKVCADPKDEARMDDVILLMVSGSTIGATFGSMASGAFCLLAWASLKGRSKATRILREQIVNKLRAP